MSKEIHVVIVYHNKSKDLPETLDIFKERRQNDVRFYLIDNGSTKEEALTAQRVLASKVSQFEYVKRENKNREAGGYWHYILNIRNESNAEVILFCQDEFHQRGKRPSNVSRSHDTLWRPYYPNYYGPDGISLYKCRSWLEEYPNDSVGFGGRRFRENIDFDPRWRDYWNNRWEKLGLEWYDFSSGACFCIHSSMLDHYMRISKPNKKDLDHPYFPWMWERMWGTIPLYLGGRLIHYKDWRWNRIEEYHPRPHKQDVLSSFKRKKSSRSFSYLHFEDLSVVKKKVGEIRQDGNDISKLFIRLYFDINLVVSRTLHTSSEVIKNNEEGRIWLHSLESYIYTLAFRGARSLFRLIEITNTGKGIMGMVRKKSKLDAILEGVRRKWKKY